MSKKANKKKTGKKRNPTARTQQSARKRSKSSMSSSPLRRPVVRRSDLADPLDDNGHASPQAVDESALCPLAATLGRSTLPEISDDDKKRIARLIPEVLSQLPRLLELRNAKRNPLVRVRIPGWDRFFYAFEADPDGSRFYGTWTPIEGEFSPDEKHWGLFDVGIDARNGQPFVCQVGEGQKKIEGTPYSIFKGTAVCGVWREEYPDKRAFDDPFVNKIEEHEMAKVTEDGLWEMLSRLPDVEDVEMTSGSLTRVVKIRAAGRTIFAFAANRRQARVRGAWSDDRGNLPTDPYAWLEFFVSAMPDDDSGVCICPVTEAFREAVREMNRTGKTVQTNGAKVYGLSYDEMEVTLPTDSTLMN